jgi:manganese-dependent inorganic pyrophosphatase
MRKEILVTGYVDPDLDSFACTFAYSYFLNQTGKEAIASISGKHHEEADHVINEYGLNLGIEYYNPEEFDKIILVDASDLDGIDPKINPQKVIEIIDHRLINMSDRFPKAIVQIEMVGSAATLIAEKFEEQKINLTRELATLLYGAIVSNTLNFKAKVTTDRDRAIAEYLNNDFHFPDDFAHKMFLSKSDFSGEKLNETLRADFASFKGWGFGGKQVGIAQIEMIGGRELAESRKDTIIAELKRKKSEIGLDVIFLTIIDLEADQNILVAPNKEIEDLLSKVLNVKFENQIAIRPGLIMRKEIVPLLKEELEK